MASPPNLIPGLTMRFTALTLLCLSLTACGAPLKAKLTNELTPAEKKTVIARAQEACASNADKWQDKQCIHDYLTNRDNKIQADRNNAAVRGVLWNQLTYQGQQWVYAGISARCGGNQDCINQNIQARDAEIRSEWQQEAEAAAAIRSFSSDTNSITQALQQNTNAMAQDANYWQNYNQQNGFSTFNNSYFKPKTTCSTFGNITQCR